MSLQRVASNRRHTPLAYFKRFQEDMNDLKYEVQTFNGWQNYSSAINLPASGQNDKKKLLKRMTQPKYHKVVVSILNAKQKPELAAKEKSSVRGMRSLVYKSLIKKTDDTPKQIIPMEEFQTNFSQLLCRTQRLKTNDIRINIRKKQQILQKQWSKLQNYRTQNSITQYQHIPPRSKLQKKQKCIINKVMKNKPHSRSTYSSQYSDLTRNNTYEF